MVDMNAQPWTPKCWHCGSRDLCECHTIEEAADHDDVETAHECRECHCRFRVVPPDHVEAWP